MLKCCLLLDHDSFFQHTPNSLFTKHPIIWCYVFIYLFIYFDMRSHSSSCAKYHGDRRVGLAIIIGEVQTVAGGTANSFSEFNVPTPTCLLSKLRSATTFQWGAVVQKIAVRLCRDTSNNNLSNGKYFWLFPDTRTNSALFEGSIVTSACPADKSSTKMNMRMEHWRTDTERRQPKYSEINKSH